MSWLPVFRFVCWNILNKMLVRAILQHPADWFKVLPRLPSACKLAVVIITTRKCWDKRYVKCIFLPFEGNFHFLNSLETTYDYELQVWETHRGRQTCVHTHKARYQLLECPEKSTYFSQHFQIKCSTGEISLVIIAPIFVHRVLISLISVNMYKKSMRDFAEHCWNDMHWNNNTHKNCWKWKLLAGCWSFHGQWFMDTAVVRISRVKM